MGNANSPLRFKGGDQGVGCSGRGSMPRPVHFAAQLLGSPSAPTHPRALPYREGSK